LTAAAVVAVMAVPVSSASAGAGTAKAERAVQRAVIDRYGRRVKSPRAALARCKRRGVRSYSCTYRLLGGGRELRGRAAVRLKRARVRSVRLTAPAAFTPPPTSAPPAPKPTAPTPPAPKPYDPTFRFIHEVDRVAEQAVAAHWPDAEMTARCTVPGNGDAVLVDLRGRTLACEFSAIREGPWGSSKKGTLTVTISGDGAMTAGPITLTPYTLNGFFAELELAKALRAVHPDNHTSATCNAPTLDAVNGRTLNCTWMALTNQGGFWTGRGTVTVSADGYQITPAHEPGTWRDYAPSNGCTVPGYYVPGDSYGPGYWVPGFTWC
jgi:hypothetical protein